MLLLSFHVFPQNRYCQFLNYILCLIRSAVEVCIRWLLIIRLACILGKRLELFLGPPFLATEGHLSRKFDAITSTVIFICASTVNFLAVLSASWWALIQFSLTVTGMVLMILEIRDTMSALAGGLPICQLHDKNLILDRAAALSVHIFTSDVVSIMPLFEWEWSFESSEYAASTQRSI